MLIVQIHLNPKFCITVWNVILDQYFFEFTIQFAYREYQQYEFIR